MPSPTGPAGPSPRTARGLCPDAVGFWLGRATAPPGASCHLVVPFRHRPQRRRRCRSFARRGPRLPPSRVRVGPPPA
eukprot:11212449-Lingulodinium_polyedra.AAC.1